MYRKYIFFLLLFIANTCPLQNQNNVSIKNNKVNICGEFQGRLCENILFNNKTEIILYNKPNTDDGDPNLLQYVKSLIPNADSLNIYILQIEYVPRVIKDPQLDKNLPFLYNKQQWYEVKITFSNNEFENYLLPASTTVTMTDKALGMHATMKISALTQKGIIIKGIKKEKNKKKIDEE